MQSAGNVTAAGVVVDCCLEMRDWLWDWTWTKHAKEIQAFTRSHLGQALELRNLYDYTCEGR